MLSAGPKAQGVDSDHSMLGVQTMRFRYYNIPKYMEWKAVFSSIPLFQVSLLAEVKRDYLNNLQEFFTKVFTEFQYSE